MNDDLTASKEVTAPPAPHRTNWIRNDGLLRDEGVLFGLTGLDGTLEYKERSIRRYYERLEAKTARERARIEARIAHVKEQRQRVQDALEELEESSVATATTTETTRGVSPNDSVRFGTGLVFALATCALNYALLYELVADSFAYPAVIAAGVLFGGMFSVFQPISVLFSSDHALRDVPGAAELWKVRLIEFGMPIAAAAFAVVWRLATWAPVELIATFLFVAFLFLVAGKLLLSTLPPLVQARRAGTRRRSARKRRHERDALRKKLNDLDDERAVLTDQLHELLSSEEIDAVCNHKIDLFRSEVELARAARARNLTSYVDLPTTNGTTDAIPMDETALDGSGSDGAGLDADDLEFGSSNGE